MRFTADFLSEGACSSPISAAFSCDAGSAGAFNTVAVTDVVFVMVACTAGAYDTAARRAGIKRLVKRVKRARYEVTGIPSARSLEIENNSTRVRRCSMDRGTLNRKRHLPTADVKVEGIFDATQE